MDFEVIKQFFEFFQFWFKQISERIVWIFNWKDATEETISSLFSAEAESETNA
ncbi:MAG: hypothetical protein IJS90_00345 [Clostridia bacterium]|nr:hypothetical protein [Clostridia bacterium]